VAEAKGWDQARRLVIVPTLLRGKLLDHYCELDDDAKVDLITLKSALIKMAGLDVDPLIAGKDFMTCAQLPNENVEDFSLRLRKLFKSAYETQDATSEVLLQRFLTGLLPHISRQVLTLGKPATLNEAVKSAVQVEYALRFGEKVIAHNVVADTVSNEEITTVHKQEAELQGMMKDLVERMERLESAMRNDQRQYTGRGRGRPVQDRTCWACGEKGHMRRDCHLNCKGPVQRARGWPRN
jgi:hypothetical protein